MHRLRIEISSPDADAAKTIEHLAEVIIANLPLPEGEIAIMTQTRIPSPLCRIIDADVKEEDMRQMVMDIEVTKAAG